MSKTDPGDESMGFERVVVLLDASPTGRRVLAAAVEMAARRHLALRGVYVEDTALVQSAELPVTREVSLTTATVGPMEPERLHALLRREARELRSALERAAIGRRLDWAFEVVRGQVPETARSTATVRDLLVMGRVGRGEARGIAAGSSARRLLHEPPCSLMIVGGHPLPEALHSVVVLYRDDDAGRRALALACRLANDSPGARLTVLVRASPSIVDSVSASAREHAKAQGLEAEVKRLDSERAPYPLASAVQRARADVLVVPRDSPALDPSQREHILELLDCAVITVP